MVKSKDEKILERLEQKIERLTDEMDELSKELTETKTIIRDYNGLREKVGRHETILSGQRLGRDYTGWVVAVVTGAFAVMSYFGK